jgi:type IV pilus assembly protein PilV
MNSHAHSVRSIPAPRRRTAQGGSALLEALVAILIFAFGVLGLVGILAASIRATNDARYRAEAANLANAVIGDMWATAPNDLDPQFGAGGPRLTAWKNLVAQELPSAAGANAPLVDLAQPGLSTQSRSVVVTVYWQMPGETVRHQVLVTSQIGKNI